MPEHADSAVKLPNLNVAVFDILPSMLQRGLVIGRREIIASDDLAHWGDCERPVACHAIPPKCFHEVASQRIMRQSNICRRNRNLLWMTVKVPN